MTSQPSKFLAKLKTIGKKDLYRLQAESVSNEMTCSLEENRTIARHYCGNCRLGHISFNALHKISKDNTVTWLPHITLFKSIIVVCVTNNIIQNIPHLQNEYGIILQNFVMDLNNVMHIPLRNYVYDIYQIGKQARIFLATSQTVTSEPLQRAFFHGRASWSHSHAPVSEKFRF